MGLILLVLLLVLIFAGAGFALHVLWIIAVVLLVGLAPRVPGFRCRAQLVSGSEEVRNRPDAEQPRTVVTGDRASVSQRPVVNAATLRKSDVPNLQYGTSFRIRVLHQRRRVCRPPPAG